MIFELGNDKIYRPDAYYVANVALCGHSLSTPCFLVLRFPVLRFSVDPAATVV